tara:strand:+ start:3682 stop:3870 length:189 start_codon:yes stop_codon:yes gene_type:complete
METDKLLEVLKEKKAIKDFKMADWNEHLKNKSTVKITLNNDDTLALDYYGNIVMQSFKKRGE